MSPDQTTTNRQETPVRVTSTPSTTPPNGNPGTVPPWLQQPTTPPPPAPPTTNPTTGRA